MKIFFCPECYRKKEVEDKIVCWMCPCCISSKTYVIKRRKKNKR